MFEQLRDELVDDALLGEQPDSSKDWLRKVRGCAVDGHCVADQA